MKTTTFLRFILAIFLTGSISIILILLFSLFLTSYRKTETTENANTTTLANLKVNPGFTFENSRSVGITENTFLYMW